MKLCGIENVRRVKDAYGPNAYLFWAETSYFPNVYFVRGENLSDAEEWFLCDPRVERELKVDDTDMRFDFPTEDKLNEALDNGTVRFNDNGTLVWAECVNCRVLREEGWRS